MGKYLGWALVCLRLKKALMIQEISTAFYLVLIIVVAATLVIAISIIIIGMGLFLLLVFCGSWG